MIANTTKLLQNTFKLKLKLIGDLKSFLGLEIAKSSKGIHLCQRKYILQLLEDIGFLGAKPLSVPMDPNIKSNDTDGTPLSDISQYKRLIGRLMCTWQYQDLTSPMQPIDLANSWPIREQHTCKLSIRSSNTSRQLQAKVSFSHLYLPPNLVHMLILIGEVAKLPEDPPHDFVFFLEDL